MSADEALHDVCVARSGNNVSSFHGEPRTDDATAAKRDHGIDADEEIDVRKSISNCKPCSGRNADGVSPPDSTRIVQAIYSALKDKTGTETRYSRWHIIFGTSKSLPINSSSLTSRRQMFSFLSPRMRLSHALSRSAPTFMQMETIMRVEFESESSKLQVNMLLPGLSVERLVSDNDDVADESDALN